MYIEGKLTVTICISFILHTYATVLNSGVSSLNFLKSRAISFL